MSKRISFSNFAETISSFLRNDATIARIWQLQDRDGTLADLQNVSPLPNGNPLLGATYNRFYGGGWVHSSFSSDLMGVNVFRAHPIPIFITRTIDIIQTEVTTLVGGSNLRLGIYSDNGSCYPGELVLDSGGLSGASLGVVSASVSVQLTPGLYWLTTLGDANVQLRTWNSGNLPLIMGQIATMGAIMRMAFYTIAQTFGPLPSTFPAGATINTSSSNAAQVLLRFSA